MTGVELKPCPFCGENPSLMEGSKTGVSGYRVWVHCQNKECGVYGPELDNVRHVVKRWNTRAAS